MPDNNFEEQARHMAERFSMEPKPDVWERVEAAIAPDKKRRRILVWWWLLPLCVAGGLAALFVNHKNTSPAKETVSVVVNQKKRLPENESRVIAKENERGVSLRSTDKIKKNGADERMEKKATNATAVKKDEKEEAKENSERSESNKGIVLKEDNKSEITKSLLHATPQTKEKIIEEKQGEDANDNLANKSQSSLSSEQKNTSPHGDKEASDATVDVQHPAMPLPDTAAANPIAIPVSKDSFQPRKDINPVVAKQKKHNVHGWQLGIAAEVGVSSWGNNLFQIFGNSNGEAKSTNDFTSVPSGAIGNSADTPFARVYQNTRKGMDAGIGVAVRKEISHRFYISGQLAYRYQEYGVNYFVSDSLMANNMFLSMVSFPAGNEIYRLHFANLSAGFGWQYLRSKKIALSVETGLDNSWLLSLKQNNGNSSGQFSFNTDRRHATHDFYQWQPYANISLPVSFTGNHFHLQVAPFARFGLRSFQKNGSSYGDNHLASAGFQAIYFFK